MTDANDYPLGYSEQEARRLAEQGALLEDLIAAVFQRAGLRAGMPSRPSMRSRHPSHADPPPGGTGTWQPSFAASCP